MKDSPSQPMPRLCGDCNLCCTINRVKEIDKPAHQRCDYNNRLNRCSIFGKPERPIACNIFTCSWVDGITPEELPPSKVHAYMVPDTKHDQLFVYVDPKYPDAWRRGILGDYINEVAKLIIVIVRIGEDVAMYYHGADPQLHRKIEMTLQRYGIVDPNAGNYRKEFRK